MRERLTVIPTKAGVQNNALGLDSHLRGNDDRELRSPPNRKTLTLVGLSPTCQDCPPILSRTQLFPQGPTGFVYRLTIGRHLW